VPRPRATDAVRAPQQRPDAVSLLDRARWSWDAAGGPALAARSPADIAQAADPVDVATGDVLLFQDDVSLPGVLPLVIGRAYRSSWRAGRWFGPSWASGGHDSSTGPSGHRVTTTSTASRRAQVARSCLRGPMCHQPRTRRRTTHIRRFRHISAVDPGCVVDPGQRACGVPVPRIDRRTRINRNNRRVPPPGLTPVMRCDGCDERGQAEAVTRSSPPLSLADGRAGPWHRCRAALHGGLCAPSPKRPRSSKHRHKPQTSGARAGSVTCRPSSDRPAAHTGERDRSAAFCRAVARRDDAAL
jgi:hypothetical protein